MRQAISDAVAGDTIEFSGVSIITLSSGRLDIDLDRTIAGGTGVTIDAAGTSSIFNISSGDFSVSDVTLQNGVSGYGSAIENRGGTTTAIRCTMTGNSAYNAGAIGNFGTFFLIDSTLHRNSTTGNSDAGFVNSGVMTIANSTISGNTVTGTDRVGGGGGQFSEGQRVSLRIYHSTIANNTATGLGGGLYISGGSVEIRNSIIADNSAPTGPDIYGAVVSMDYNLIEDLGGVTVSGTALSDINGTDPMLGPLADNGGSTLTMAVGATSAAYGARGCLEFDDVAVTTDRRGYPRPVSGCSIGAYEDVIPETCEDGIQNQEETDVDCGGSCNECVAPTEDTGGSGDGGCQVSSQRDAAGGAFLVCIAVLGFRRRYRRLSPIRR